MFIHSGTLKRAGILAAVVAVGTAAAITYNAFLSSDDGLPEVLSPLQPIIKDEDGGVKQKTDIAFSPDGSFFDEDISVELKAKDKTATIYYTTNGETPTKKSNRYTNPIKVHSSGEVTAKTIKAIAVSETALPKYSQKAMSQARTCRNVLKKALMYSCFRPTVKTFTIMKKASP